MGGPVRIGAIIQARMGSRRLPGKVLRPLAGRPMLQYVLERAGRCRRIDELVVSTSTDAADDAIVAFCQARGVNCDRGPLENVAARFRQTVRRFELEAFARICADSPLIDPELIDQAADIFHTSRFDLVTNSLERTFPPGQTIEVLSARAFQRAYQRMYLPEHFEHVTRYFYENAEDFAIFNIAAAEDYRGLKLAVDTPADLERIDRIVRRMRRPHWEYDLRTIVADCCALSI